MAGGDNYKVTVFVDGLNGSELPRFTHGLRDLHIQTRKVRGVRKDENDALIRLADDLRFSAKGLSLSILQRKMLWTFPGSATKRHNWQTV